MTDPTWTVTTSSATGPEEWSVTGQPDLGPDYVTFLTRVGQDRKHIVALFPMRNILAITSDQYVKAAEAA